MSSQENKRKNHKKKSPLVIRQTPQFASLPHELVVSCLARVSKSYYPTLSLVCKSFRSLIASAELYQTRSLLNRTESFLYVCLWPYTSSELGVRWFTLCRKPNRTPSNDVRKKNKKPTENILVPIASPFSPAEGNASSRVVVGSDIYDIGGLLNGVPSSRVWVLDCKSQKWHKAPDMLVKRAYPLANVIDGKIYVVGGQKESYLTPGWMEVFDPKTQTWNHVSSAREITEVIYDSVVIDGKLYIDRGVSYNPKDGTCEPLAPNLYGGWYLFRVINNVLFRYDYDGVLKWYSFKGRHWRNLKGLKGLPKFPSNDLVGYADYGGNMVVLWDECVPRSSGTRIWCAEITLERCNNEEDIWGTVVWFDVVLEVPFCCLSVVVVAATV